jgi:hypothetical protein
MTSEQARQTLEAFIRGDAMIGIMPNAAARETEMVDAFWASAQSGDLESWKALGEVYGAGVRSIGAYDGAKPSPHHPWPAEPEVVESAETPLGAALRCHAQAVRGGDRKSLKVLLRLARLAEAQTKRFALTLASQAPEEHQADAAYERGLLHFHLGETTRAAELHHQAAAQGGHGDACFELYCLYSTGQGVPQDEKAANDWLTRAAKLGQPRALYNLGAMYATGRGVEQSWPKAVEHYERAANQGNARAAFTLAEMYTVGEGVEVNEDLAAKWLSRGEELEL